MIWVANTHSAWANTAPIGSCELEGPFQAMQRQTLAIKCLKFSYCDYFLITNINIYHSYRFCYLLWKCAESILKQTEIVLTNVILIEGYKQKKTTTKHKQFSFDCGFLPFLFIWIIYSSSTSAKRDTKLCTENKHLY